MNRTLALFLALVALLAHTLAIYTSPDGSLAPPYDMAHVAFRLARNWVQAGSFAFNPDLAGAESYPSLLWIAVAAFAERFYFPVTTFCQTAGIVAALGTVLVLAQFSPGRLAGVIAPLLFVVSGGVAAAAASGTELAPAAFLVALTYLAWERRRGFFLALGLTLTCLARTEGALFCIALFGLELISNLRGGGHRRLWWPWIAPLFMLIAAALFRHAWTGSWHSPGMETIVTFDRARIGRGLFYVGDFFQASGSSVLLLVPLWYALRGVLSGLGTRALILALIWIAIVLWTGGGASPFYARMVPILALVFVAIQEGMVVALDSKRRILPNLAWTLFLLGLTISALASKYPGNLGPLPTEALHRRWMQSHTTPAFGMRGALGRMGLAEEIAATQRLRALGIFLRDQAEPSATVLTAWPGAIGYLSRLHVLDVLGRATVPPGSLLPRTWQGEPRTDVVAALAPQPDYVIPIIPAGGRAPTMQEVAQAWVKVLDIAPDDGKRSLAILDQLKSYEMVAVPLGPYARKSGMALDERAYLLRRKDLDLAPKLLVQGQGLHFEIGVRHLSHEALVDLRVQARDETGTWWTMRPDGSFGREALVLARRSILLFTAGERAIHLASVKLPSSPRFVELRVGLRTPSSTGEGPFSEAARTIEMEING